MNAPFKIGSSGLLLALCLFGQARAGIFEEMVDQGRLSVRVTASPQGEVVVTQRVLLTIEIASASRIIGNTVIENPEMPGALVMQRLLYRKITREYREGVRWELETREMEVYPRAPGVHQVPPIEIEVTVRGERFEPIRGKLRTSPFRFTATVPPGAPDDAPWIATSRLSVSESWDRPLDSLKAGTAREREVTLTGERIAAMMLPPLPETTIPDVSIYPRPPELLDDMTTETADGVRKETRTYFFAAPAGVALPEHRFHWWNLEERRWEVAVLSGRTLEIGGTGSKPAVSPWDGIRWKRFLVLTTLAGMILWFLTGWVRKLFRVTVERFKPWLAERRATRRRWRRLRAALRTGSAPELVEALYRWIGDPGTPLKQYAGRRGDPVLESLIDELLARAYGRQPGPFARSGELRRALKRVRKTWAPRPWTGFRTTSFRITDLNPHQPLRAFGRRRREA